MAATRKQRDRMIAARVNEKEYQDLRSNAERLGTTPSGLIRAFIALPVEVQDDALHDAGKREGALPILVFDRATFPQLTKQIRMWGYHYDQAVHALNTIAAARFMRPDEAKRLMERAIALLEEIEQTRLSLEREASEMALESRAYLPLGRDH